MSSKMLKKRAVVVNRKKFFIILLTVSLFLSLIPLASAYVMTLYFVENDSNAHWDAPYSPSHPYAASLPNTHTFTATANTGYVISSITANNNPGGIVSVVGINGLYTATASITVYLDSSGPLDVSGFLTLYSSVEVPSNATAVLKYSFENETGTTTYDYSGYSNNGVLSGVSRSYDGAYGLGALFSGSSYITTIDDSTIDLSNSILMSAWIKPISVTESVIFDKPNAYGLYLTSGGGISLRLAFSGGEQYFNTSAGLVSINNWYHIVAKYTGYAVNITINEVSYYSANTAVDTIAPSAFDLIIGDQFYGYIDELILGCSDVGSLLTPITNIYPYIYSCTVSPQVQWLVASANYNFTSIFVKENSTFSFSTVKFNFTDGVSEIGLNYDAETATYTQYTGLINGTTKVTFVNQNYASVGNAAVLSAVIQIGSSIQSKTSVDVTVYCTDTSTTGSSSTGIGSEVTIGTDVDTGAGTTFVVNSRIFYDMFGISGIGGVIATNSAGDGAQILGGSIFDVMAMNSSLTVNGSYAKAEVLETNFQHINMLVHVYQATFWDGSKWVEPSLCHETAWFAFGVDCLSNNSWTGGWYVNITVVDGLANADNGWVRLECSWYNIGSLIKTDTIYAMYEAYTENDTTTQFTLWVDLWLSNNLGSSQVGGHVSSMYYGMTHTGWWIWGNWGPVGGLATSSTFYDYLYDSNGNVTTASTLNTFTLWSEIAKTAPGPSDYSDACLWALQVENIQIQTLAANKILYGINSPVFQPTTTPDMPVGFFASLSNALTDVLTSIQEGIKSMVAGGTSLGAEAVNSVFSSIGISDFTTKLSTFIGSLTSFTDSVGNTVNVFSNSVTYIANLIVSFFTLLSNIGMFLISWFGGIVTSIINIGSYATALLTGQPFPNGVTNPLDMFQIGVLTQTWSALAQLITSGAIFIFLIVWWFDSIDKRAKQYGGGWMSFFMSDIQSIISVFSFILDLAWRVVTTVIDLGIRFANIFGSIIGTI